MKLTLKRFGSTPHGTFGVIHVDGIPFYTVERPWRNNERMISCVPLGEYELLWRPTTTSVPSGFGGHTWYLQGGTVSFDEEPGKLRYRCAIHRANIMDDVMGCIGIGKGLGYQSRRWSIINSGKALGDLLNKIGSQDHQLNIINTLMG